MLRDSSASLGSRSVTGLGLVSDLLTFSDVKLCSSLIISGHCLTAELILRRDLTDFICLSTSIQLPSVVGVI